MKNIRIRRPKEHDELLNALKEKDDGVFDTLKSALVFAAAVGFKKQLKRDFSDTSEQIPFQYFDDSQDKPFIYALALTEYSDVRYLREENFDEVIKNFEEYAAGGLDYLDGVVDRTNLKESLEALISENDGRDLIFDIAKGW